MKRQCIPALLIALMLPFTALHGAELLQAGDRFPEFKAKDQHDADYEFRPGTKAVLIAFDMATGKATNRILVELGAGFLDDHETVYVSNIFGMPGIGRMFAIPKMRKYQHRIVLAEAEDTLSPFPQREGHVTIIRLYADAAVESISFWNPAEDSLQDYLP